MARLLSGPHCQLSVHKQAALKSCFQAATLLAVLLTASSQAAPSKPSCMQAWLAKAGIPQPQLHSYEDHLVAMNISVQDLLAVGTTHAVEDILHSAGIIPQDHRRAIADCLLNRTSACFRHPCLHGGRCDLGGWHNAGKPSYSCKCKSGFEGIWCELESCLPSTCRNGGRCSGPARRVLCRCPRGFAGSHCQIQQNECLSRPCKNGARCLDGVNGYHCACRSGFSGRNCDIVSSANTRQQQANVRNQQAIDALNGSLATLQKEVGQMQVKLGSLDSWVRRLWCSGGDGRYSRYGYHQGCHYCLFKQRRSFKEALGRCRVRGSDLASIHSHSEGLFVRLEFGGGFWLGGHDKFVEGLWQWTDGSPFTYAEWMKNEPSNSRGREHCAVGFGAGWADERCSRKRFYICKICPQPARA